MPSFDCPVVAVMPSSLFIVYDFLSCSPVQRVLQLDRGRIDRYAKGYRSDNDCCFTVYQLPVINLSLMHAAVKSVKTGLRTTRLAVDLYRHHDRTTGPLIVRVVREPANGR